MPTIRLKVSSPDATFLDFYEPLARARADRGTVYTPYTVVPLEARMPLPLPAEILVELESDAGLPALHQTIGRYLAGGEGRRLRLERGERVVEIETGGVPAATELAAALDLAS